MPVVYMEATNLKKKNVSLSQLFTENYVIKQTFTQYYIIHLAVYITYFWSLLSKYYICCPRKTIKKSYLKLFYMKIIW